MEAYLRDGGKAALKVTWIGLGMNLFLVGLKGTAGVFAHSTAMLADAADSLSDALSDVVTLWALRMAHLPKDENHPYGHGKFETLATLFVSVMLTLTAFGIFAQALERIHHPQTPGIWAVWAALLAIGLKFGVAQAMMRVGRVSHSRVLMANAQHHRSDILSSIVVLLGVGAAQAGWAILDPLTGMLVAAWIIKTAFVIGRDSIHDLTDESVEKEILEELNETLQHLEEVESYHEIRARRMGPYLVIDLHIQVNSLISVSAAHQIAERVRLTILEKFHSVNDVLVHVDAEEDLNLEQSALMRPQKDIEQDVRRVLAQIPAIEGISHILCHFLQRQLTVQVEILVAPELRVAEVQAIARQARQLLESIPDIHMADIHLELDDQ